MAVQTKRLGQADMESLLKNRRAGKGELPYIGVVHRLDQPVSGVMVFAKTKEAAAALGRQIASGLADKFYYAVTDGVPEAGKGQFTDYLLHVPAARGSDDVCRFPDESEERRARFSALKPRRKALPSLLPAYCFLQPPTYWFCRHAEDNL